MSPTDARSGPSEAVRILVALVPVACVLVGLRLALARDGATRNLEYMPDMARSPAVESQATAARLPGGLSQQPLVAGVVPRGRLPFGYGPDEDEARRAGRELTSPVASDDVAAATRGAEVFRVHCVPCHDAAGAGQGPAVLRGMLPPPSLLGAAAREMPDGQIYHLLTLGRGNMPAMRARLGESDRWAVIRHVRALQAPVPAAGDPEEGR